MVENATLKNYSVLDVRMKFALRIPKLTRALHNIFQSLSCFESFGHHGEREDADLFEILS